MVIFKHNSKNQFYNFQNCKEAKAVTCILIRGFMRRYLLSRAAASEGTSPAKPEMTVAAARQCLPSMNRP